MPTHRPNATLHPVLLLAAGLLLLAASAAAGGPRHVLVLYSNNRLLPANIEADGGLRVGVPIEYDFAGTIDLALRLHPRAGRLVLVTGASAPDRAFEERLRREVPRFQDRAKPEFLAGLPTAALRQRLAELDAGSVVFTTGYFQDGAGLRYVPRDAARALAAASAAPVYAPFDPFIGTGIVGGYMPNFAAMGRQAGHVTNALSAGAAPTALHLPPVMPTTLNLDWRAVRRWGIDPAAIPASAQLHFKAPTFLEDHRGGTLAAAVLFLLQSGLIAWLLIERRRRREAELAVQKQRFELAHTSRLAVAGELTASIAHEINQPLGAILTNADAADIILESCLDPGLDRRAEPRENLGEILADIRRDVLRASEVIRRLRALLDRHEVERQPFDLNEVIRDTQALLSVEARSRGVTIETRPAPGPLTLVGDRVQMQQVLINLLFNAMEALADVPEDRRRIVVSSAVHPDGCLLRVRDQGPGIAPAHLPRLFDSFFTTKHQGKRQGMGLGLSIARTLVEAHGGRIHAGNATDQGAVFHCTFPAAPAADTQSPEPA